MADAPDPYRVLGVARGATKAQIKAAHRALAKRYHPDAATGDSRRFRDVHEAYQLLADPLRRREWDVHHSAGPMRADEPAKPAPRRRRPPTAEQAPPAAPRPDPTTHSYRWSASEVPWWEEGARSENRRQPGARRPRTTPPPPAGARPNPAGAPGQPSRSAADFEVYNRSSGAAWSSAARQYFRRFDADLPRHGQFRRQASGQPLTAARARVAADEEARAQAQHAARNRAQPSGPPRQNTSRASPSPNAAFHTGSASAPASAAPPRPAYAFAAGVARNPEQVNAARAAAERVRRAATWPTLRERLVSALLAWIPLALVAGYGGSTLTGCDQAAVGCPEWFGPAQTVAIAILLGLLVALPRVAFVGAAATLATTATGVVVVAGLALYRLRLPLPPTIALIAGVLIVGTYLGALAFVALNRRMLPWIGRP